MQYKKIQNVNKPVSELIYGTASEPFLSGQNADDILEQVFASGINTIDTARNYQLAEKSIGHWFETYGRRDEVVLLTKCGHPEGGRKRINEKDIREDYTVSSKYLHTGYFDIYLLHRDDPDVEVGEIVEIFNALHAEGKIGAFGGSNWTHRRIEEANEYAYKNGLIPFTVSSPNFSLAHQAGEPWDFGTVTITGPENEDARNWYRETEMPVVAYSSLARGLFSGKLSSDDFDKAAEILDEAAMKGYCYPENFEKLRRCEQIAFQKGTSVTAVALNWVFHQNLNVFAVVSTANPARMKENVCALDLNLTKEELCFLDE